MEPLRIVLVTHFYPAHGGGIERVAAQLVARMAATGDDVVWCASDCDPAPAIAGVRCAPMAGSNAVERATGFPYPLWTPAALRRLARLIRASDAVHVHDCIYFGSLVAAWLARRHRKRLVVTQHIGVVPLPWLLRPLLALANRVGAQLVLARADGVGFVSPQVRRHFESLTGQRPRWRDVANGVDGALFSPAPHDAFDRLRATLGFDAGRPLLLFVGRFVAKKRLPLLRRMAALRPDWQWCLIGHGPERPQSWMLPNVRVMSPLPQPALADHYRVADLLALPSHGEGFPLVIQEAMACGLPACITADVAAGAEMPPALWIELRDDDAPESAALQGVRAIDAWLELPASARQQRRDACARFAAAAWSWNGAVRIHRDWLHGTAA